MLSSLPLMSSCVCSWGSWPRWKVNSVALNLSPLNRLLRGLDLLTLFSLALPKWAQEPQTRVLATISEGTRHVTSTHITNWLQFACLRSYKEILLKLDYFILSEKADSGGFMTMPLEASLQENQITGPSLNSDMILSRFLKRSWWEFWEMTHVSEFSCAYYMIKSNKY